MDVIFNDGFKIGEAKEMTSRSVISTKTNAICKRLMVEAKDNRTSEYPLRPIKIYLDGRKDEKPFKYYSRVSDLSSYFVGVGINWLVDNLNEEEIAELMIFRLREKFEEPDVMLYP